VRTRSAIAKTAARFRIEDDLQQSFAVAKVDEDDAAMVAAADEPSRPR